MVGAPGVGRGGGLFCVGIELGIELEIEIGGRGKGERGGEIRVEAGGGGRPMYPPRCRYLDAHGR